MDRSNRSTIDTKRVGCRMDLHKNHLCRLGLDFRDWDGFRRSKCSSDPLI